MKHIIIKRGFTLVELLVVIAIVGLLSSIVLASVTRARTNAMYAKAKQEMRQIQNAMIIAQGEEGTSLIYITANGCSECVCRTGTSLIGNTGQCYSNWVDVITDVVAATDGVFTSTGLALRDPWGSPYLIDENELEGSPTNCTHDSFRTAGPDGIWNTTDDYAISVPYGSVYCATH